MSKIVSRFEPTYKPSPIVLNVPKKEKAYQNTFRESLGKLPLIYYNGVQVDTNQIEFFELSFTDNLPSLKVHFTDSLSLTKDKAFPLDDTFISIFIHPRTSTSKPIFMEFKIVDFKIDRNLNICFGILNLRKLFIKEFKSYPKKTSFELYQEISKDLGLGFYSNIENTNDRMTWINTGDRVYEFINKVLDNCYLDDKSSILGYVDYYYNFVFADLQKELDRDISQDLGSANTGIEDILLTDNREKTSGLFLTNDIGLKDTNSFFDKFKILNNSSRISITKGYQSVIKYYDQISKEYLLFDLKSQNEASPYKIPLNESAKDRKYNKQNLNYIYEGKLDSDNVHKNFNYAIIQNDRNLVDLERIGLEIELPIPNFSLYKFQKIYVAVSNQFRNLQQEKTNQRLSGQWLITNIRYRYADGRFRQIINLVRKDLTRAASEVRN
jgi:hypothetical protein